MKSYVEETMHVDVKETEKQMQLPLSINNAYKFRQWIIQGQSILFALPQTNVSVITLEKHFKKIEQNDEYTSCFWFQHVVHV